MSKTKLPIEILRSLYAKIIFSWFRRSRNHQKGIISAAQKWSRVQPPRRQSQHHVDADGEPARKGRAPVLGSLCSSSPGVKGVEEGRRGRQTKKINTVQHVSQSSQPWQGLIMLFTSFCIVQTEPAPVSDEPLIIFHLGTCPQASNNQTRNSSDES